MAAEEIPGEWADLYDYDEEDMYDEDEMEKYYFSSAAGEVCLRFPHAIPVQFTCQPQLICSSITSAVSSHLPPRPCSSCTWQPPAWRERLHAGGSCICPPS